MGFNVNISTQLRPLVCDAGFDLVTEEDFEIPSSGWPKERRLKEAGTFHRSMIRPINGLFRSLLISAVALREGLQAIAMAPLTRVLGWTSQEVELLLAGVRSELDDRSIHSSITT